MIKYLIGGIVFATIVSWLSFIAILLNINPGNSDNLGVMLFYASLFFSLAGTLFIGLAYFRKKRNRMVLTEIIHNTFRQSIFLSAFFIGLLFLKQSNMLNIISGVCLVVFVLALEVYFSIIYGD